MRKCLFMCLSVRVHLLKDVSACHHISIQWANMIKHILVLSGKAHPDSVFQLRCKHISSLLCLTVNASCCKTVTRTW